MESHSPFYEVIRCIASGTFGVVFEARDTSNKRVAIKRQEKSLPRDRNMQLLPMPPSQEHLALLELKGCEHVVEMLDFFHTKMEEKLIQNIVMEFIPRNLTNLIMRFNCNVPEPIIKRVAFQIFKGLTQVHEKGKVSESVGQKCKMVI
jgi:serine/threonine protein kinase